MRNKSHGTPEQFENAVRQRISELSGDIESATRVDASYIPEKIPGLIIQTIDEAYETDGGDGLYDSIEEYAENYYDMPASKIKTLYGLYDGSNEDTGIETTDGKYYIAYSGHGVVQMTRDEMLHHFARDVGLDDDVESNKVIRATEDVEDDSLELWRELRSKQILDFDGFWTEYTLYVNEDTGEYVCVFGDRELYTPENSDHDFSTYSEDEAYEWFDDYDTSEMDGEDDIYDEIHGATNTCGISPKPVVSSEVSYIDQGGVLGEPGERYTYDELEEMYLNDHDNDPVMERYDSFDHWFNDTKQFLSVVNSTQDVDSSTEEVPDETEVVIESTVDTNTYSRFRNDVYDALASVGFKYANSGFEIDQEEFTEAFEFFLRNYFIPEPWAE